MVSELCSAAMLLTCPSVVARAAAVARGAIAGASALLSSFDAGTTTIHLLANPGQDVAPIGAARQEDSLLESQMQLGSLQYPHNPMKGASEHHLVA